MWIIPLSRFIVVIFITFYFHQMHSTDREYFERNVVGAFTEDVVSTDPSDPDARNINITITTVRSVKVATFYKRVKLLRDTTDIVTNSSRSIDHIQVESVAERNIMTYFDKVWFLNELADDRKMKTICEIGFDHGYSSLNFLLANPTARIFSLDNYEHDYVSKGVKTLMEMFPDRELLVIRGDSRQTASRLAKLLKESNSLCNLVYIDGGQTTTVLRHDIANMKRLLDPSFHRIVIDGIDDPQRAIVWNALLKSEHFVNTQLVPSIIFSCIVWDSGSQYSSNSIVHEDLSAPYVFNFNEGGLSCPMIERGGMMGVGSFTSASLEPCTGVPLVLPGRRRDGMSLSINDANYEDMQKACPSSTEFGWLYHDEEPISLMSL